MKVQNWKILSTEIMSFIKAAVEVLVLVRPKGFSPSSTLKVLVQSRETERQRQRQRQRQRRHRTTILRNNPSRAEMSRQVTTKPLPPPLAAGKQTCITSFFKSASPPKAVADAETTTIPSSSSSSSSLSLSSSSSSSSSSSIKRSRVHASKFYELASKDEQSRQRRRFNSGFTDSFVNVLLIPPPKSLEPVYKDFEEVILKDDQQLLPTTLLQTTNPTLLGYRQISTSLKQRLGSEQNTKDDNNVSTTEMTEEQSVDYWTQNHRWVVWKLVLERLSLGYLATMSQVCSKLYLYLTPKVSF